MKTTALLILILISGCCYQATPEKSFIRKIEKIGFEKQNWTTDNAVYYDYLHGRTFVIMKIKNGFWEIYDGGDFFLLGNGYTESSEIWNVKQYVGYCNNNLPDKTYKVNFDTIHWHK